MSNQGIRIHLHVFGYNSRNQLQNINALKPYCENIYVYPRKKHFLTFLSLSPYIMVSRFNKELLNRLRQNHYPILFEGLHTSIYLKFKDITNRPVIVRSHNIEHLYYYHLFKSTTNFLRKIFFLSESIKLFFAQSLLKKASAIATISQSDQEYFQKINSQSFYLPPFFYFSSPTTTKDEPYILYHGNLSVFENEKAALWLIQHVFKHIKYQIIIAGKSPSLRLQKAVIPYKHIHLIDSPSNEELEELIQRARINLLYSFQDTGIKLKLLHTLFSGNYCIANQTITAHTGLKDLCIIANTPQAIFQAIESCMQKPFSATQRKQRLNFLHQRFNFDTEAKKLLRLLSSIQ